MSCASPRHAPSIALGRPCPVCGRNGTEPEVRASRIVERAATREALAQRLAARKQARAKQVRQVVERRRQEMAREILARAMAERRGLR